MGKAVPIKNIAGIELIPVNPEGVCMVQVSDPRVRMSLPWDRFIRLEAVSKVIEQMVSKEAKILDVGGYDGALALFLPGYHIDLVDPVTTGRDLLKEPLSGSAYDVVVAVDVLEHINPVERKKFLQELSRMARFSVILNYPRQDTKLAQALVLKATENALIREHVEWELPDTEWVLKSMQEFGFSGQVSSYGSLAVWLGQYLILNLVPDVACSLDRYLVEHHFEEPFSTALYELITCARK